MDAVHAWDQPDFHFHVPHCVDHSVDQVIRYQTSLKGKRYWGGVPGASDLAGHRRIIGGS
jgi:hypothetical protein